MLDLAEANPQTFNTIVLRPGGVLPDDSVVLKTIASVMTPVVAVSVLARALVRAFVEPPANTIIENDEILQQG